MNGPAEWILGQRRARVIRGTLASLFGIAAKILLQIWQVPLFLHVWSTEQFGEWLLVTSIPTYLALSGLGFGAAAGNAISRLSASGDRRAVRAIIRAAWLVLTGSSLLASTGVVLASLLVDVPGLMGLHWITGEEFTRVLVLLCCLVCARMQFGLAESAFRASGRYPSYVMLENTLQVLEFAGAAAALAGAKTADAVVIGMLAVRLSGVAGVFGYLALRQRWVIYGEADPLTPWVRSLIRPSLGFVIMPISQSLSLQGTLLVVGHFLGPMSVAVLSTARTLARLVETALSMIYNLVYEEVGYAAGAGDRPGLRRIIAWSTAASMLTGLGLSVALLSFGPVIYRYWTHGKIALDYGVLTAVVIASLVRALLTPAAAVLAGLNQHGRYSVVLFGATVASLALAVLVNRTGLVGIASTAIVMEVLIAVYALPRGLAAAGTSIQDIIADLRDPAGLRRLLSRRSGGRSQPAE